MRSITQAKQTAAWQHYTSQYIPSQGGALSASLIYLGYQDTWRASHYLWPSQSRHISCLRYNTMRSFHWYHLFRTPWHHLQSWIAWHLLTNRLHKTAKRGETTFVKKNILLRNQRLTTQVVSKKMYFEMTLYERRMKRRRRRSEDRRRIGRRRRKRELMQREVCSRTWHVYVPRNRYATYAV